MDRDSIEIKLLTMRQKAFDMFRQVRSEKVISFVEVNYFKAQLEACNEVLSLYRTKKEKGLKHAETWKVS